MSLSSSRRDHLHDATDRGVGFSRRCGTRAKRSSTEPGASLPCSTDVLVNNGAWNLGIPFPQLDALTPEIWDRIFDTNVRGPFQLARAAARHMSRQGAGRMVNVASVAGLWPTGSSIAYASSKAALIHLTRCLAVALAPEIAVNCVAPGYMEETRMGQRVPKEIADMARQLAALKCTTGIDDVAAQVVAFCRSDSVTGQVLAIDAGIHFH